MDPIIGTWDYFLLRIPFGRQFKKAEVLGIVYIREASPGQ